MQTTTQIFFPNPPPQSTLSTNSLQKPYIYIRLASSHVIPQRFSLWSRGQISALLSTACWSTYLCDTLSLTQHLVKSHIEWKYVRCFSHKIGDDFFKSVWMALRGANDCIDECTARITWLFLKNAFVWSRSYSNYKEKAIVDFLKGTLMF